MNLRVGDTLLMNSAYTDKTSYNPVTSKVRVDYVIYLMQCHAGGAKLLVFQQ